MKFFDKYGKKFTLIGLLLAALLSATFYFLYLGAVKTSLGDASDASKTYLLVSIVTAAAILLFISLLAVVSVIAAKVLKYTKKKIHSDNLTGVGNAEMILDFYNTLGEKAKEYAFVYIHVNNFPQISSTFTFDTGNQLLKDIAICLKASMKEEEAVAHIKSNVFALLLKFVDEDGFSKRLEIMIKNLEKLKIKTSNKEFTYSTSYRCGIFPIPNSNLSYDEISTMARIAYTTVKRDKNGGFAFFNEDMKNQIQFRSKLLSSAGDAIRGNQIEPYFQPKKYLKNGAICGAELFARWNHPEFGIIASSDFISVLETSGNILELDLYMIEQACKLLKKWLDEEHMPVPLSVNISKFNLYEINFSSKAIELVGKYGVPANLINLEINGNSLMGHEEKAIVVAESLKKQGFILTIDNFGKNEIPMELLYKLPINTLNINGDFLRQAQDFNELNEILNAVISVAHKLKISVCAVGVETQEQDSFLTKMGCDCVQGYYYYPVEPQNEFEKIIF